MAGGRVSGFGVRGQGLGFSRQSWGPVPLTTHAKHRFEVLNGKRLFYRVTSLIRNNPSLGPYSRLMPRDLW